MNPTEPPSASQKFVTFFVPAFNEEHNIQRALASIVEAAATTGVTPEILVYDDCSKDGTAQKVEEFGRQHPTLRLELVRNSRTYGLGYNYVEAAFRGSGRYFMLVNGDADITSDEIVAIVANTGKADIIIPFLGQNDARRGGRKLLSVVFTGLINLISGHKVSYYNGPVLHLRYNVMRWHPDSMGFAYQAELITRLLDQGATFLEVPIRNSERDSGVSKALSFKNFLSVSHSIVQIFLRRVRKAIFGV